MVWSGVIGFGETEEVTPGVWEDVITERKYKGFVIRNRQLLQTANQVNDNVRISNTISIVADPYANQNFHKMIYITFKGIKWKVSDIDIQYPRIMVSLGGVYNG